MCRGFCRRNYHGVSLSCEHYKSPCPFAGGAEDGAMVCYHCSKNTAKGIWPTRESLPIVQLKVPVTPHPIPVEEWPFWAKFIRDRYAEPEDAGVGDTVKRCLGQAGESFELLMKSLGMACRCGDRREAWNTSYPYANPNGKM